MQFMQFMQFIIYYFTGIFYNFSANFIFYL